MLLEATGCARVRPRVQQEGGHDCSGKILVNPLGEESLEELIVASVGVRDKDERVWRRQRDHCLEERAPGSGIVEHVEYVSGDNHVCWQVASEHAHHFALIPFAPTEL